MTLTRNPLRRFRTHALALASAVAGLLITQRASAQPHTIAEPSITACIGALLDSGGEGAIGYSNNENFTTTICSDQPGQSITLNWITFTLNTDGPDPIDQVTIYDGADINAPLIGVYSGLNSPGIVAASFANTSGCLTVSFTSNASGTGVFAATILCYTPCEPPTAVAIMSEAAPALICQGESVDFNASASFAAAGYNVVEYAWNFDDGSPVDSVTGAVISHTFQEPGEYVVQIVLTDDNECNNTNLIDLPVWVSTTPVFDLGPDLQVCLGEEVNLTGNVAPTTWNALPNSDLGGGIFLPDNVGETFTTTLFYNVFAPGAQLASINQLEAFCVSMEHSFMGDIVIQLVCPNGQSVVVHQQGGGGTFLGEPVDDDFQPDVQGVCYDYCWSPTATNGTWVDNAGSNTLPAGTYESLNPMSALQGCPLNGTWTLNITDLWGSDNGFVCEWGLDFDPSLYPELTSYTPDLGLSTTDSAFWSGNNVILDPNPALATVVPMEPGSNDYVFSVTDNFGCTYTDVVNVSASGPLAAIGVNPASPQPVGVTAQFTDLSLGNGSNIIDWSWDFGPNLPGSTLQNPVVTFEEAGLYTITLTVTATGGCSNSVTIQYLVAPSDVIVPNVFSPNGDGQNDALEFTNAQYFDNNHLQVYNRWGNLLYENRNYRNNWRPNDVSEGTYYFIFAMQDGREWTGHVTLLR
ncbi:MAG: PKD domain-containing protein [Flavobacteriales bacterium]|nr:PKD domain-containing protein [Flavobacteriales bacterium]